VYCSWEDGHRLEKVLDRLDRWEVHAADGIDVTVGNVTIHLQPQPRMLAAAKVGVGACLWDSALVLTAYLGVNMNRRAISVTPMQYPSRHGDANALCMDICGQRRCCGTRIGC